MKKIFILLTLLCAIYTTNAQYKKASFLNKNGRTYGLSILTRALGGGNSPAVGFTFSYGREKSDRRLFYFWDVEYAMGNKFKYNTTSENFSTSPTTLTPVAVSGKTSSNIGWKFNVAYYLLDNGNEENKILPFVDLSLGIITSLKSFTDYTTNPSNTSNLKTEVKGDLNAYTAGVGAGVLYKINNSFGIKLYGGYFGVLSSQQSSNSNINYFKTLPNHIGVNIGAHWLLDRDK